MFHIECTECEGLCLVTNRHIQSIHSTSEGMIGYVKCPSGHTVIHRFAEAYPKPKPPVSVVALQQADAA